MTPWNNIYYLVTCIMWYTCYHTVLSAAHITRTSSELWSYVDIQVAVISVKALSETSSAKISQSVFKVFKAPSAEAWIVFKVVRMGGPSWEACVHLQSPETVTDYFSSDHLLYSVFCATTSVCHIELTCSYQQSLCSLSETNNIKLCPVG